jgi:hypothetical protein
VSASLGGSTPTERVLLDAVIQTDYGQFDLVWPPLDTDSWEDIVEVSVTVPPDARPSWRSWSREHHGRLLLEPGTYRVRVSERGRDHAHAYPGMTEAIDGYLVQLWRAPTGPDSIVKVTSADARSWHEENGGHRWPPRGR